MALRFPNRRFGSGSFAFPAPSSTFAVTGRVPEGFPCRRPPRPKPEQTTYLTLASPSKLSLERWSHLSAGPPLVRFARPSADTNRVRQLPGASSHRHGAATRRTCSARVVSHHLDGLLRTRPRGLVASRSRPGVRRVSGAPEPVPSCPTEVGQTRWRTSEPLPRDAGFHTLRRVSSSTAGTASPRSVAFLSLPALSHRDRSRSRDTRGGSWRTRSRGVTAGRSRGDPLARAIVSIR